LSDDDIDNDDEDDDEDGGVYRVSSMNAEAAGQVDYRAVISLLNWRQNAVPVPTSSATGGPVSAAGSWSEWNALNWRQNAVPVPTSSATGGPVSAAGSSSEWNASSEISSELVQVVRVDALIHDMSA